MATDEGQNDSFIIKTKDNKYNGFDRGEYNVICIHMLVALSSFKAMWLLWSTWDIFLLFQLYYTTTSSWSDPLDSTLCFSDKVGPANQAS